MAGTSPTAEANPDAFVGKVTLSAYEPYPIVSSTVYSSDAPASIQFIPWEQPGAVGLKNLVFLVSMNAVVPLATSTSTSAGGTTASTGSEGFSYGYTANIFKRQDYSANSTNLVTYATGSGGVTAQMGYSGASLQPCSQTFGLSWVTNTAGGTSGLTTTTSDGGWSSFVTGPKFLSIPFATSLSAGEYWLAVQHSSTSGTSNSNVTLLSFSKLLQQWPVVSVGSLGGTATIAFSGPAGIGIGVASAITTNTTMPASVISASTQPLVFFAISNV